MQQCVFKTLVLIIDEKMFLPSYASLVMVHYTNLHLHIHWGWWSSVRHCRGHQRVYRPLVQWMDLVYSFLADRACKICHGSWARETTSASGKRISARKDKWKKRESPLNLSLLYLWFLISLLNLFTSAICYFFFIRHIIDYKQWCQKNASYS